MNPIKKQAIKAYLSKIDSITNSIEKSRVFGNMLFAFLLFFSFQLNAQYTIKDTFAAEEECSYMSRDIFIVWWDKDYDYTSKVDILLDEIIDYKNECLNDLNMMDPPGVRAGYYQNIYIHTGDCFFSNLS